MNKFVPIFLLTTERSGSNLLRAILSMHSAISSPPPSGIVEELHHITFRYLNPSGESHLSDLANDAITFTQTHMNPWDVKLSPEQLLSRIGTGSFWALFRAMNDIYAESKGCPYWFSKEPGLFNHIYEICLHFPDAKFIYMVRDGRDVATSMLRGRLHANNILQAANRWAAEQRKCLNAFSDPLIRDKGFFLVKYEELVEEPARTTESIMRFLGLEFEQQQLSYFNNEEIVRHSKSSKFWENVSKPIDPSRRAAYKTELTTRQVAIFESIAWNEMKTLGYETACKEPVTISHLERYWISLSSKLFKGPDNFIGYREISRRERRRRAISKIINR